MEGIEFPISALVGSAAGGGSVVFLAKLYLQRAFKDLDDVVDAMHEVQKELVTIAEKIKNVETNDKIIQNHETRLTVLENLRRARNCGIEA